MSKKTKKQSNPLKGVVEEVPARPKEKGGGGCPKMLIKDWEIVKRLGAMQCTVEEIAAFLGMSQDSLERRAKEKFGETIGEKLEVWQKGGKASLRRKQWLLADTNAGMAIFLGKNILGQQDNPKIHEELDGKLVDLLETLRRVNPDDATTTKSEAD